MSTDLAHIEAGLVALYTGDEDATRRYCGDYVLIVDLKNGTFFRLRGIGASHDSRINYEL